MTRDEAIKWLKVEAPYIEEDVGHGKEILEAYAMAIEALERMPSYEAGYNDAKMEIALSGEYERAYERGKADAQAERDMSCEDCISRQALRQKLREHHDFFVNAYGGFNNLSLNDKFRVDEITNCIAMVVNAPSVTPQQKIGEWLKNGELCKCSNCHSLVLRSVVKSYNYCFWCGAKMEVSDAK